MKKLFSLTFLLVFAFAAVAFAQTQAPRPMPKKVKVATIEQATAIANEAASKLEGYSVKEVKVLEGKKKKGRGAYYEAVLDDRDGHNKLSLIVSDKGYIKCITLSDKVGTNGKRGMGKPMVNKKAVESKTEAEQLATEALSGYNGFVISGIDDIEMKRGKGYLFTVLDSYKNKYYILVGPYGVKHGLMTEDSYNRKKAYMQEKGMACPNCQQRAMPAA